MNSKLKHVIEAIIFVGICLILVEFLNALFISNDILGRVNVRGIKNENEKDLDVVLMGPSTLIDFYSPYDAWNEYGIVSYNYSGTGFRSDLSKYYLEDIRTTCDPAVFAIEMSTMDTKFDLATPANELGLRNWSDSLFFLNPVRIKGIADYLPYYVYEKDETTSYYVPVIKYHTNYEGLAEAPHWRFALGLEEIHGSFKGYYGLQTHTISAYPRITDDRAERSEVPLHYLNEILDYCDKNHLTVLFFYSPHPRTNRDWKVFNTWGDIIRERGYEFLDMNRYYDEIGLDVETDYANYGHVNHQGALKCTSFLAKYLADNYDLTDRRDDEAYGEWRDDYEYYQTTYADCAYHTESAISEDMADKEIGEALPMIDDFDTWYYTLINSDLDAVISTDSLSEIADAGSPAYCNMIDRWQIEPDAEGRYTAAFRGTECMFRSGDGQTGEVNLGEAGLDVECVINADEGAAISYTFDEEEISFHGPTGAGINIVVYDNAYYTVRDEVTIKVDSSGKVILSRD